MIKYDTVEEYLQAQSEPARQKLEELRTLLQTTIPEAQEVMSYGIPCYNLVPNATLEQRIMIAGYKKHVSLYPHPDTIVAFQNELEPFQVRKGTIQFSIIEDLPSDLIKRMILHRMAQCN